MLFQRAQFEQNEVKRTDISIEKCFMDTVSCNQIGDKN